MLSKCSSAKEEKRRGEGEGGRWHPFICKKKEGKYNSVDGQGRIGEKYREVFKRKKEEEGQCSEKAQASEDPGRAS